MYLRIRVQTKSVRELELRVRNTINKIGEFYLSDYGRQPQIGQNSILAYSRATIKNWKISNSYFKSVKAFSKSSGPLLAGLPPKTV